MCTLLPRSYSILLLVMHIAAHHMCHCSSYMPLVIMYAIADHVCMPLLIMYIVAHLIHCGSSYIPLLIIHNVAHHTYCCSFLISPLIMNTAAHLTHQSSPYIPLLIIYYCSSCPSYHSFNGLQAASGGLGVAEGGGWAALLSHSCKRCRQTSGANSCM